MDDLEKDFADLYNLSQEHEDDGTITCIIYDDQFMDTALNFFRASFRLKKEDLKEYVYVDKLECENGYEDYYLNRTYKLMYMDSDRCAIFYRNYENLE